MVLPRIMRARTVPSRQPRSRSARDLPGEVEQQRRHQHDVRLGHALDRLSRGPIADGEAGRIGRGEIERLDADGREHDPLEATRGRDFGAGKLRARGENRDIGAGKLRPAERCIRGRSHDPVACRRELGGHRIEARRQHPVDRHDDARQVRRGAAARHSSLTLATLPTSPHILVSTLLHQPISFVSLISTAPYPERESCGKWESKSVGLSESIWPGFVSERRTNHAFPDKGSFLTNSGIGHFARFQFGILPRIGHALLINPRSPKRMRSAALKGFRSSSAIAWIDSRRGPKK
jgi:hypothetical protein